METLELSRLCRLCGKYTPESAVDIFDSKGNYLKKINRLLPISVHEMDFLPKYMCLFCSYKLTEFNNFYNDCLQADHELKSQLSWMQPEKDETMKKSDIIPMVQIKKCRVKEEFDLNVYDKEEDNENKFPLIPQLECSMNLDVDKCEISEKAPNIEAVKRNLFSLDLSSHQNTYAENSRNELFIPESESSKNDSVDNLVIEDKKATKTISFKIRTRRKSIANSKIVKPNDLKLLSHVKVTLEKLNIEKIKLNGKLSNKIHNSRRSVNR